MSIAAQPTAFIDVSVNTLITTVVTASHVNLLFFTVPIVRSGWQIQKAWPCFCCLPSFFLYVLCSESLNIIKPLGPTGHLLCKNYEGEKSGHFILAFSESLGKETQSGGAAQTVQSRGCSDHYFGRI